MYSVKELFYTLQGEGAQTGTAAVFCRFSGCNLWSGREEDRESAACRFCDTDFVGTDGNGGGKYPNAALLASKISETWRGLSQAERLVVFTGGEPLLQLDTELIDAVKALGFRVAIETNGTLDSPPGVDWICVSPKGTNPLRIIRGDELKLVYPQAEASPERFGSLNFKHFFLQPMDGPNQKQNMAMVVEYCLAHSQWRLSLQTHKVVGIR